MIDKTITDRARTFNEMGIDAFDALHLATAESVVTTHFAAGEATGTPRISRH